MSKVRSDGDCKKAEPTMMGLHDLLRGVKRSRNEKQRILDSMSFRMGQKW